MIISPGDVDPERDFVEQAIIAWNDELSELHGVVFLPTRWERSSPRQGAPGQDILNEDLVDISDVGIAVFWERLGTKTRTSASGAVEEVERFAAFGKLHCVLFKKPSDPPPGTDQYLDLLAFKNRVHSHEGDLVGLTKSFSDGAELRAIVHRYLTDTLPRLPEVAGDADLTLDQQRVLSAIVQAAFAADFTIVNTTKLNDSVVASFSRGRLQAALQELSRRGMLSIEKDLGELGIDVQLGPEGILQGTRGFTQAERRVRSAICRMAPTSAEAIAQETGLPSLLVTTIARRFADDELVNVLQTMDMTKIRRPTSSLCDWERIRHLKACLTIGPHFPNRGDALHQSFDVDLLNEGEHEAREVRVTNDVWGEFPEEQPSGTLPYTIPPRTPGPESRYHAGFVLPWPERGPDGEPIKGQERIVRLRVTFRDGLEERDEAIFTLRLRNAPTPNRWDAEELRDKARLSPICSNCRMESR